jgi:hypothetical protein
MLVLDTKLLASACPEANSHEQRKRSGRNHSPAQATGVEGRNFPFSRAREKQAANGAAKGKRTRRPDLGPKRYFNVSVGKKLILRTCFHLFLASNAPQTQVPTTWGWMTVLVELRNREKGVLYSNDEL